MVTRCDQVLHKTNYQRLFLSAELRSGVFATDLSYDGMSVLTYSNQQDGYLFGYLTKYIRRELRAVHYNICRKRERERLANYDALLAEQHGALDGETASLGNGYFVSQAGEAWYKFRCRQITAHVRPTDQCFSALPVTLQDSDLALYQRQRELSPNVTVPLFLEAHSRRLTDRGIAIPCSEHFPAVYAGATGSWLQLRPGVHVISPPPILNADDLKELHLTPVEDLNFETGGIYMAGAVRSMERHTQTKRAMQDVSMSLGQAAQDLGWSSDHTASHAQSAHFKPESLLSPITSTSLGALVWHYMSEWGAFASVFTSLYLVIVGVLKCYGNVCLPGCDVLGGRVIPSVHNFVHRCVHGRERFPLRRPGNDDTDDPPSYVASVDFRGGAPPKPDDDSAAGGAVTTTSSGLPPSGRMGRVTEQRQNNAAPDPDGHGSGGSDIRTTTVPTLSALARDSLDKPDRTSDMARFLNKLSADERAMFLNSLMGRRSSAECWMHLAKVCLVASIAVWAICLQNICD